MSVAFVLGNGVSRQGIDLDRLRLHGKIYGCNALYRDFIPDVLVATDKPISEHIQHSGYAVKNILYTRRPLEGHGAHRVPEKYWGYSSGPLAVGIAAIDKHSTVYLLGFDMAGVNNRFNNVYADTEFYKRSAAPATYSGNWERQILQVMKDYPHTNFVRVHGAVTAEISEFLKNPRYKRENIGDFKNKFGV
jgi:hypothetical protein